MGVRLPGLPPNFHPAEPRRVTLRSCSAAGTGPKQGRTARSGASSSTSSKAVPSAPSRILNMRSPLPPGSSSVCKPPRRVEPTRLPGHLIETQEREPSAGCSAAEVGIPDRMFGRMPAGTLGECQEPRVAGLFVGRGPHQDMAGARPSRRRQSRPPAAPGFRAGTPPTRPAEFSHLPDPRSPAGGGRHGHRTTGLRGGMERSRPAILDAWIDKLLAACHVRQPGGRPPDVLDGLPHPPCQWLGNRFRGCRRFQQARSRRQRAASRTGKVQLVDPAARRKERRDGTLLGRRVAPGMVYFSEDRFDAPGRGPGVLARLAQTSALARRHGSSRTSEARSENHARRTRRRQSVAVAPSSSPPSQPRVRLPKAVVQKSTAGGSAARDDMPAASSPSRPAASKASPNSPCFRSARPDPSPMPWRAPLPAWPAWQAAGRERQHGAADDLRQQQVLLRRKIRIVKAGEKIVRRALPPNTARRETWRAAERSPRAAHPAISGS